MTVHEDYQSLHQALFLLYVYGEDKPSGREFSTDTFQVRRTSWRQGPADYEVMRLENRNPVLCADENRVLYRTHGELRYIRNAIADEVARRVLEAPRDDEQDDRETGKFSVEAGNLKLPTEDALFRMLQERSDRKGAKKIS